MTSPYALLLSIVGTVFGFVIALVGIIGQASIAPTSAGGSAMAPGTVAVVAQEVSDVDPVIYTVALGPAESWRR